jgi:hypothetical protein
VKVGREIARWVHSKCAAKSFRIGLPHLCPEFELPEDLKRAPLIVVVETDEGDARCVVRFGRRNDAFDEVLTLTHLNDVTDLRRVAIKIAAAENPRRSCAVRAPRRFEEARGEGRSRALGRWKLMAFAGAEELLTSHPFDEAHEAELPGAYETQDLRLAGRAEVESDPEMSREFEETSLREGVEDSFEGR